MACWQSKLAFPRRLEGGPGTPPSDADLFDGANQRLPGSRDPRAQVEQRAEHLYPLAVEGIQFRLKRRPEKVGLALHERAHLRGGVAVGDGNGLEMRQKNGRRRRVPGQQGMEKTMCQFPRKAERAVAAIDADL
jgi:hypothetical protein